MNRPEDISAEAWDAANEADRKCQKQSCMDIGCNGFLCANALRAAIGVAIAEVAAERDLLQDVLDGRPAVNSGLPESYVRWSQAIYAGDFTRAAMQQNSEAIK